MSNSDPPSLPTTHPQHQPGFSWVFHRGNGSPKLVAPWKDVNRSVCRQQSSCIVRPGGGFLCLAASTKSLWSWRQMAKNRKSARKEPEKKSSDIDKHSIFGETCGYEVNDIFLFHHNCQHHIPQHPTPVATRVPCGLPVALDRDDSHSSRHISAAKHPQMRHPAPGKAPGNIMMNPCVFCTRVSRFQNKNDTESPGFCW